MKVPSTGGKVEYLRVGRVGEMREKERERERERGEREEEKSG